MFFRTDIAIEANEKCKGTISGVNVETCKINGLEITKVLITDGDAEKKLQKPKGTYITVEIPILTENCQKLPQKAEIIATQIKNMLPQKGLVLVAGLGNNNITADNLGPMTAKNVLATRHISPEIKKSFGLERLRNVAVISPGVLGQTGIESAEIILSLSKKIKPVALIVVDAFASSDIDRIGKTVQISDSGISPGSGVLNSRAKISRETMEIPVISIGVPTVVDATSLISGFAKGLDETSRESTKQMIVTTREIDILIQRASVLIAMVINSLLQPSLSADDIEILLS